MPFSCCYSSWGTPKKMQGTHPSTLITAYAITSIKNNTYNGNDPYGLIDNQEGLASCRNSQHVSGGLPGCHMFLLVECNCGSWCSVKPLPIPLYISPLKGRKRDCTSHDAHTVQAFATKAHSVPRVSAVWVTWTLRFAARSGVKHTGFCLCAEHSLSFSFVKLLLRE